MNENNCSQGTKLLWIASYPKSGNTWMRMFLSAYRNGGNVNINSTGAFAFDDMHRYTTQVVSPKPYTEMDPEEMAAVRGAYLVHMINTGSHGRMFMKTHSCVGTVAEYPNIPQCFTEGAIYIVRDPRDVVCSYNHHCDHDTMDKTIDFMLKDGAAINHDSRYHALGTWGQHVESWLQPHLDFPRHIVRYEDMLSSPKKTFKGVVDFLGWDYDETLFSRSLKATSFERLKKQEEKSGFREQSLSGVNFFRKGKTGSWKEQLSDNQEKRLTDAFSEIMETLGYLPKE